MKNILKIELSGERKFGLDILRMVAILCVIVEHGGIFFPENLKKINDLFVFDGVSIFFVLSGFLIGGILIKLLEKNQIDRRLLMDFWIRRWFRTLPNYFLVLFVLIILQVLFTESSHFISPGTSVYKYFIFSQNLFSEHPWFFPEAWSLCIEEWFYLLIPFFIFLLITLVKLPPRISVLATALIVLCSVTVFRFIRYESITVSNYNDWDNLFRKQVFTRLDSLMYGLIGAYINFYFPKKWLKRKLPLLVAGITLFISAKYLIPNFTRVNSLYNCVFSFSIVSTATLCLLPFLSDLKSGRGFIYKSITYISLISYSMYLLNYAVIQWWILDNIPWTSFMDSAGLIIFTRYVLYWVLVIVMSILLYKYFEIPMTRLRDNTKIKKTMMAGALG